MIAILAHRLGKREYARVNVKKILVGIPTLNGPERLDRCLAALEETTPFDRFQVKVLVCDDGSNPDLLKLNKDAVHRREKLRELAGLEMYMNEDRLGIAKSWNRLTRFQPSDVVVLINDDVEVVTHWLDVLAYSVMENPNVGMVGLNCYGGMTRAQARALDRIPLEKHYYEATLHGGGMDGALLSSLGPIFAFRRELFDHVGGFDERYFVFYEEFDFGVTLRKAGFWHYMAEYPVCFHMGGATNSDARNLDAAAVLEESRKKFFEKWAIPEGELETFRRTLAVQTAPATRSWNTQIHNWR